MTGASLADQTIVVTGANTGIGRATAEALAARGAHIVLAGRSEERTSPVIDAIRRRGGQATFVELDLADLESVRACSERLTSWPSAIDVLINNAGLAGHAGLTRQGFELTFGTNHLGHFLLTVNLLPKLREARLARIVTVSSGAHYRVKGIDWSALRTPRRSFTGLREYAWSKLANVLFTRGLAAGRAGASVRSFALNPGRIASDIWRRIPWPFRSIALSMMKSNEEGAQTSIHCASSPDVLAHDGAYFDRCRVRIASEAARDDALVDELWRRSEDWTRDFRLS